MNCEGTEEASLIVSNKGSVASARVRLLPQELKMPVIPTPELALFSFLNWLITSQTQFRVNVNGSIEPKGVYVPRLYSFDRMSVLQNVMKGNIASRLPPYPHERGINLAW